MINFFRKIRKNLADDTKPLKYARYAIGEIVLVVIGILIALSIINWNQDHNNKKADKYYLNQMKIDHRADILSLSNVLLDLKKRQTVIQNFLKELHTKNNKESFNLAIRQYINTILIPLFFCQ